MTDNQKIGIAVLLLFLMWKKKGSADVVITNPDTGTVTKVPPVGSTVWQGPGKYDMQRGTEIKRDVIFYYKDQFQNYINAGYSVIGMVAPQFVTGFWGTLSRAQIDYIQNQNA